MRELGADRVFDYTREPDYLAAGKRVAFARVKPYGADLEVLRRLCEQGKLKPVLEKRLALAFLAAAHECSRAGHAAGKIAMIIAEDKPA